MYHKIRFANNCGNPKSGLIDALLSFACFSWELASALKESKERFDSAGVKLIAVGVGTPDKARLLAERVNYFATSFLLKNLLCYLYRIEFTMFILGAHIYHRCNWTSCNC